MLRIEDHHAIKYQFLRPVKISLLRHNADFRYSYYGIGTRKIVEFRTIMNYEVAT